MNKKQLTVFMRVVEYANLSMVATMLGLTQPAVSSIIKKLESEMNVTLFTRSGKSLIPNDQGKLLYRMANELTFTHDLARISIDYLSKPQKYIIVAMDIYSDYFLNLVGQFSFSHPDFCFVFHDALLMYRAKRYSCADFYLLSPYKVLNMDYLSIDQQNKLFAILPTNHPLARQKNICLSDLRNEYFVFLKNSDRSGYEACYDECLRVGFQPKTRLVVDIPAVKYASIAAGCGIGLIYNTELTLASATKNCIFVEVGELRDNKTICLAWNPEKLNNASQTFLEYVRAFRLGRTNSF